MFHGFREVITPFPSTKFSEKTNTLPPIKRTGILSVENKNCIRNVKEPQFHYIRGPHNHPLRGSDGKGDFKTLRIFKNKEKEKKKHNRKKKKVDQK